MANSVQQINDRVILVNGKVIRQDMEGDWIQETCPLTPSEAKALNQHLRAIKFKQDATQKN